GFEPRAELRERGELAPRAHELRGAELLARRDQRLGSLERTPQAHQVARTDRARGEAAGEALEIADAVDRLLQRFGRRTRLAELLDGVEALADRGRIDQRIEEPPAEQARAHRRPRAVEHPEERAAR